MNIKETVLIQQLKMLSNSNENQSVLQGIKKGLKRWINRQDEEDDAENNFDVSQALEQVYVEIKRIFAYGKNMEFEEAIKIYIDLFQSTGNNKHRFLVEKHMKELLRNEIYEQFKASWKYYDCFQQINEYYPFLVFRLLQSQYKMIFEQQKEEVIKLYSSYIKFANTRRNIKLIEQYLQEEVNNEHGSIDKMSILLQTYVDNHEKIIKENMLKQIIKLVMDYNMKNENFKWRIKEDQMHIFCQILFKIQWPASLQKYKSRFALDIIKKWENGYFPSKKSIHIVLNTIQINEKIRSEMQQSVKNKITQTEIYPESFGLNCQFLKIVLEKFKREEAQKIMSKDDYQNFIKKIIKSQFNREEGIKLLDVIRQKNIFNLSQQIDKDLQQTINEKLRTEKMFIGDIHYKHQEAKHMKNLLFILKIIVLYKFKQFDTVYHDFKKLVLRDNKIMKQCGEKLKNQSLKVCLHYLNKNKFSTIEEQQNAFRDIIELTHQQISLKQKMIEYIVEHIEQRFFEQNQLYSVYRDVKYQYLLFEDFATNELNVRIFSIKIICYLAEEIHQYKFFIKNAFKVLYDRLSVKGLLRPEQKLIGLRIIRELMKLRGQIFQKQVDDLSKLLINELHKSIQLHSPQMTSVSGYILKIFQAMMRKLPEKMVKYIPFLARYTLDIINYRIIKKQLKRQSVVTLCQMAQSCRYVILPYFHFPDLYHIIRQILLADDHYYYYQDLMLRLIGRLGYVGNEQYTGLEVLNKRNRNIEQNFKMVFSNTFFITEYQKQKQKNEIENINPKKLVFQDVFYSEQKMNVSSIEIQNFIQYIITTLVNNISLGITQTTLIKSLETLQNVIPHIKEETDQQLLHKHIFYKLFQIEEKHSQRVLDVIALLLDYHDIGQWSRYILKFYLKKMYNHRKENQIIRQICIISQKYNTFVEEQLINLIIILKKIIIDSVEEHHLSDKIRYCFTIILNMGKKIDQVLHLFFTDLIKLFSYNHSKTQKLIQELKDDIPEHVLESYLVFLIQLTNLCSSVQYFIPAIRQFFIFYFKRQMNKFQKRDKKKIRQMNGGPYRKKLLSKLIDAMIYLMVKYGKQCESFINILHTNLRTNNIYHQLYNSCESYLKKHSSLDQMNTVFDQEQLLKSWNFDASLSYQSYRHRREDSRSSNDKKKKIIKQIQKFVLSPNHTIEQDELWLDNLAIELFQNTQIQILKACSQLASYDKLFRFNMFVIPFYFFWRSLFDNIQPSVYTYDNFDNLPPVKHQYVPTQQVTRLTSKIRTIMLRKEYSIKVRQKILECIYFLQRNQIPFMVKDKVLYDIAIDVEDPVKGLFYLQRQYENDPDVYIQLLYENYKEIGQSQSAAGLQKIGDSYGSKENKRGKEKEKINQREKGQQLSLIDLEMKRNNFDWNSIYKSIEKESSKASKSKFAHFAIESAINLGQWQQAKTWVPHIDEDKKNQDVKLLLTMLNIHDRKYQQAQKAIADIRYYMHDKIRQMFSLSYDKSMKGVIFLQQVSQLEQIVQYEKINNTKKLQNKFSQAQADMRKSKIMELWNDRQEGIKNNLSSMQKIMNVRRLLLQKNEDLNNRIRFCKLALSQGKTNLARQTYEQLKQLDIKDKNNSLEILSISVQIDVLEQLTKNQQAFDIIQKKIEDQKLYGDKNSYPLIFQIYQKFSQRAIEEYKCTVEKGNKYLKILKMFPGLKDYYQISHYMGLLYIRMLQAQEEQDKKKIKQQKKQDTQLSQLSAVIKGQNINDNSNSQKSIEYMLGALRCFIKSVTFTKRQNNFFFQDCLKILNLISMRQDTDNLVQELKGNYMNIPRDGLIEIIPQLIARLDRKNKKYEELMKDIIVYIGKQHPQTLLFPLIYLKKGYKRQSQLKRHQQKETRSEQKRKTAEELIANISANQKQIKQLFEKAQELADQICKISLKLTERMYIKMKHIIKLVEDGRMSKEIIASDALQFCKNILSEYEKPSSPTQFGFIQQQKSTLFAVIKNLTFFKELSEQYFYEEAIILIRQIKQRTKETLSSMKTIFMEQASNKLFKIRQSQIFLFGTYSPHYKNVKIDSFKNQIQIISSKQRPKKIVIVGSDQKEYNYLIKGKQDLRLDQRIMQLFTFINKMFHKPSEKESYSIQGYSILPISYEIGIIAWVQGCDTMGSLIQKYRIQNGILVQNGKLQNKLCRHIYPKYPEIQKYHKVQIYHEVCRQISGMDLKHILCKRSQTSQKWLKNRTCFIRSLAVMSIVGYIIGLGDRHPFNIMIQRDTWKIVHIDFGDCFQVNKMRTVFPEKVPFRLTRMIVNAMGACKTDGIFKHTCEKILKILRINKQSILVIVQAFKYDPLFGWKLEGERLEHQEHMQWEGEEAMMLEGEQDKDETFIYFLKDPNKQQIQKSTEHILNLIKNKLVGRQNDKEYEKTQSKQVDDLIKEATNPLNLVQHFQNWCIFW